MHALIVGGGIAGPATALALHKAGITSTVLEANSPDRAEAGSYFTLSPNGLAALAVVDALPLARRVGFPTRRNVMVGSTGRHLGAVSLGRPLADGSTAITLKRSRLAALLAEEARRRGVEVRTAARVTEVADEGDHAVAVLADGTRVTADLLVGADGVRSLVRRTIDPSAPAARYVGLTNFGGITRDTRYADDLPPQAWQFVFGRGAFFGAHPTPGGDVVWFVNVPRPEIGCDERRLTVDSQWQDWLRQRLAADAGRAADLVAAGELELAGDNTFDLGHVPTWHRGRMVIIGDAAHAPSPSSGQGGSMALEDAVTLAKALRDTDHVEAAFGAFETVRRARVERIVATGARSSSAKIPGPFGRIVRDAALRAVFRFAVTDRSQEWMTGYRVDWDSPTLVSA